MQPQWVMNGIVARGNILKQKWSCSQCEKKCTVETGINYEPGGGICPKQKE